MTPNFLSADHAALQDLVTASSHGERGREVVAVSDLVLKYGNATVLERVNLSLHAGRLTALVGPNGTGKSTLLKAIAGVQSFSGTIRVDGKSLKQYKRRERVRKLSFVAQHGSADTDMKVREVVELARLVSRGPFAQPTQVDRQIARDAIEESGVAAFAERPWNSLSGGEQQRVQLARAITQAADVLLLDEPTNHLDIHHQFRLIEQLQHLAKDHNVCVVIAMHDLGLAARFCDEVIVLAHGTVAHQGTPQEVLTPQNLARVFGVDARLDLSSGHPELTVDGAIERWGREHEHPARDVPHHLPTHV